jgi:hypothetical protein
MIREAFIEQIKERDKRNSQHTFHDLKSLKETYDKHINFYDSFQYHKTGRDEHKYNHIPLDYSKFPSYEQALAMVTELIEKNIKSDIWHIRYMTEQKIPFQNNILLSIDDFYSVFRNFDPMFTNRCEDKGVESFADTFIHNRKVFDNLIMFMFHAAFETNFPFLAVKRVETYSKSLLNGQDMAIVAELKDEGEQMTPIEAKELTLEVWRYLAEHPEIIDKFHLPGYLWEKIVRLDQFCPLCELYRGNSHRLVCPKCPLQRCNKGSLYYR